MADFEITLGFYVRTHHQLEGCIENANQERFGSLESSSSGYSLLRQGDHSYKLHFSKRICKISPFNEGCTGYRPACFGIKYLVNGCPDIQLLKYWLFMHIDCFAMCNVHSKMA